MENGVLREDSYELQAGQTFSDGMASPIVLKPLVSGDVWCLLGSVNLRGTPGGYYLPEVSFSGFLASGTLVYGSDSEGGGPYIYPNPNAPQDVTGFEVELIDRLAGELGPKPVLGQGPRYIPWRDPALHECAAPRFSPAGLAL